MIETLNNAARTVFHSITDIERPSLGHVVPSSEVNEAKLRALHAAR